MSLNAKSPASMPVCAMNSVMSDWAHAAKAIFCPSRTSNIRVSTFISLEISLSEYPGTSYSNICDPAYALPFRAKYRSSVTVRSLCSPSVGSWSVMSLTNPGADNPHRFLQHLPGEIAFAFKEPVGWYTVNSPYNIHSAHNPTKCGESLLVGVAGSTKVKTRLIADGDKEIGS